VPLYDLGTIQRLVAQRAFLLVNERCRRNYKELAWGAKQMQALIAALRTGRPHYRKSRCGMDSDWGPLDVDCYVLRFNEDGLREDRRHGLEYWLELALPAGDPRVAIVSFHLSRQP